MSQSRTQQAIQMVLRERISQAEAARRVGVTVSSVSATMRKMGMRGHTEAGRRDIADARRGPMSMERLAKHTAIQAQRLRDAAAIRRDKMGIDLDRVISLHIDEGKTYGEVAKICGLTRCQVAGYIHRYRKSQATKEIV